MDKLTVLLLDDNSTNLLVQKLHLERLGFAVITAAAAMPGIRLFQQQRPQLIIMDCQMPGMDGFAASRVIRLLETKNHWPRTPIIAVTGNDTSGNLDIYYASGMDDAVTKPVDKNTLRLAISKFMTVPDDTNPEQATASPLPTPHACAILDAGIVYRIQGYGHDTFAAVYQNYVNDLDNSIRELRQAQCARDMTTIDHVVHTVKGSAGSLGATDLATLAVQIEAACQHGYCPELHQLLDRFIDTMAMAQQAMQQLIPAQ